MSVKKKKIRFGDKYYDYDKVVKPLKPYDEDEYDEDDCDEDDDFDEWEEDDEYEYDEDDWEEEEDDDEYDEDDWIDEEDILTPLDPKKTVLNTLTAIFGNVEHIDVKTTKLNGRIDTDGLTLKAAGIHFEKTPEMIAQEKKGKKVLIEDKSKSEEDGKEEFKKSVKKNNTKKKKKRKN